MCRQLNAILTNEYILAFNAFFGTQMSVSDPFVA